MFFSVFVLGLVCSYYSEKMKEGKIDVKLGEHGNFLFHGRDLTTKHDQLIARVEAELFYEERDIFDRFIETGWEFDRAKWRKFDTIKLNNKPQIEFIDYNVAKIGRPGTFDQHTDNYSTVTIICMLSDHREDFKGGLNYFYVNNTFCNWDERDHWDYFEVQPEKGDCIFFRGEVVTHGITDVIAGWRTILQIEMQSLKKPKKARHLWMLDQPDGEVPGEDCYLPGDQD
ncbi:hypothetical protein TrLO_g1247 [Triparma laevis f. longispina]|uniref:Fe2OG dioxygenase domain-containing protein n=1 Tax=Triparma laevis f. longispina TaxID=1714387 RepID=A0A9W7ABE0_9STRA|nr:hypothetical protein TrLO_g1247 [Triparma laevis f. longispina]